MLNISIRRKAEQFGTLVRHSALTPRTGVTRKPVLVQPGHAAISFIGHSSFFLQLGGKNFVIDPNWAPWLFVLKRLRRPGLRVSDLPPIDAVLVSHAHFDHLHRPSLRAIARHSYRKSGRRPIIIVPPNVRDLVFDLGYKEVFELNCWNTLTLGSVKITATPANHWGARVIHDGHRGFVGFVLRSRDLSVYHSGDTAYFDGFHEIGQRLKPEVALLPIGAYHPPSFRAVHMSPEDALQAFVDLNARLMIPMHYGTFKLSHEPVDEPVQRLLVGAEERGISDRVRVLEEGVTAILKRDEGLEY
jgi:L-ascorbate metabolism protein UlaG (beta-lactamase superfamily)